LDGPDHKGWHRRGYLPHFDPGAACQFITYRLADSLPKEALRELRNIPKENGQARSQRFWELLDAGHGSCCLRDPGAATIVQDNLLHFHPIRYGINRLVRHAEPCALSDRLERTVAAGQGNP
jgi:hypothetical protein